jgi:hypothetical protein
MALGALDVGDETDAAGVMFIGWIVKTLRLHGGFLTAEKFEDAE